MPTWKVSHPFKKHLKKHEKKTWKRSHPFTVTSNNNKKKTDTLFPSLHALSSHPSPPAVLPWPTWGVRTARDRSSTEAIREACRRHPTRAKRWWLKTNGNRNPASKSVTVKKTTKCWVVKFTLTSEKIQNFKYVHVYSQSSFRMMKLNQPFQWYLLYIVTAYRFTKKKGCQTKTTQNSDWPDVAGPPSFRPSCCTAGGETSTQTSVPKRNGCGWRDLRGRVGDEAWPQAATGLT